MPTRSAFLPLILVAGLSIACGTRTVYEPLSDGSGVQVFLSHRADGRQVVAGDDSHPSDIPSDRLVAMLSHVEVDVPVTKGVVRRNTKVERHHALGPTVVEPVAQALSEALGQATPDQRAVVRVMARRRRLNFIVRTYATTFVAFVRGDELHLDFDYVDWELEVDDTGQEITPNLGSRLGEFKVVATPQARRVSEQQLALALGAEGYDYAAPAAVPAGADVASPSAAEATPPPAVSPETKRELRDLEAAFEHGEISESYYERQREKLLEMDTAKR